MDTILLSPDTKFNYPCTVSRSIWIPFITAGFSCLTSVCTSSQSVQESVATETLELALIDTQFETLMLIRQAEAGAVAKGCCDPTAHLTCQKELYKRVVSKNQQSNIFQYDALATECCALAIVRNCRGPNLFNFSQNKHRGPSGRHPLFRQTQRVRFQLIQLTQLPKLIKCMQFTSPSDTIP